jgi:hypothetical protein
MYMKKTKKAYIYIYINITRYIVSRKERKPKPRKRLLEYLLYLLL